MDNLYKINNDTLDIVDASDFFEPTVLCIPAIPNINAGETLINIATELSRINYVENNNDINFVTMVPYKEGIKSIIDKYFLPLVSNNNEKIDIREASRNLRNINILAYCYGVYIYSFMEKYLIDDMKNLSYTDEEINEIINNIAVIGVSTDFKPQKLKSTFYRIIDIYDDENIFHKGYFDNLQDYFRTYNLKCYISPNNKKMKPIPNNFDIYYSDLGTHTFRVFGNNCISKPITSIILASLIDGSIRNSKVYYNQIDTFTINEDIKNIVTYKGDKSVPYYMEVIDAKLNYYKDDVKAKKLY